MAEVSQTTDVTELGQKDKFLSERKFSLKLKKEKSPLNDQEVTASIELKPEMNDESLCCTFSKNINM